MTALVLYLLLAIGVSFLCSLLEASLLSMTPSFASRQESGGGKTGKLLASLKANVDRPLAAILTLNTAAHTVGAAGVGAQAVAVFGDAYVGAISALLTLLILFASEIVPKTLGALHWRALAPFTAYGCRFIIVALFPLVWVSERLTALLQPKSGAAQTTSRDEVLALVQLGESEGVFAESETRIVRNLIRFRAILVESIMTPRTVVFMLPENSKCGDAMKLGETQRFSRIPLYSESRDRVTGYVLKSQLLERVAYDKHDEPLKAFARSIRFVSEKDTLSKLFNELFTHKEQIAVAVDEFGGMAGVVTTEDLIETLLGLEIVDEYDESADMQELARKKWLERARQIGIVGEEEEGGAAPPR